MDLPLYCIVGDRPVKAIETEDGGMDVLAYEWDTGEFKRAMQYLSKITLGDGEIDYVSEEEFEQYVEKLRQQES